MNRPEASAQVDILLPTFNGEKYLPTLLDSIANQSYQGFCLIARDDGSLDRSQEILLAHRLVSQGGGVLHINDANVGVVENINRLCRDSDAPYLMFADQDDAWFEYKVEASLQKIREIEAELGEDIPILVFTDAFVGDENLEKQSSSLLERNGFFGYGRAEATTSFKDLLVQNVASGCTMIINRSLKRLATPIPKGAVMHDWWIALVASSMGSIEYISDKTMIYRLHSMNTMGLRSTSWWKNMASVLKSPSKARWRIKETYKQALAFHKIYAELLDSASLNILNVYTNLPKLSTIHKWKALWQYRFRKNRLSKTVGLCLLS